MVSFAICDCSISAVGISGSNLTSFAHAATAATAAAEAGEAVH